MVHSEEFSEGNAKPGNTPMTFGGNSVAICVSKRPIPLTDKIAAPPTNGPMHNALIRNATAYPGTMRATRFFM